MCFGNFHPSVMKHGHLGPRAIGDEERVVADVEWRRRAEFAPPLANSAHVLKVLVQHVNDHTQHPRKVAGDKVEIAAEVSYSKSPTTIL